VVSGSVPSSPSTRPYGFNPNMDQRIGVETSTGGGGRAALSMFAVWENYSNAGARLLAWSSVDLRPAGCGVLLLYTSKGCLVLRGTL
jgi:hypothetical protein